MKKVMGMLSLEHYCRAIWDGRERERVFENTQLRQGEGKGVRGRMDW